LKHVTNRTAGALGLPPSYARAAVDIWYRELDDGDTPILMKQSLCAFCGKQMRGEAHAVGVRIFVTVSDNPSMDITTRGHAHPLCAPIDWAVEMLGKQPDNRPVSDSPIARFFRHKTLRDFIEAQVGRGGAGEGRDRDAFDAGIK